MEWLAGPLLAVGVGLGVFLFSLGGVLENRAKAKVEVSKNELETEKLRTERARLELKKAELETR